MNTVSFEVTEQFQSETEEERKEKFCRIIEQYISSRLEKDDLLTGADTGRAQER